MGSGEWGAFGRKRMWELDNQSVILPGNRKEGYLIEIVLERNQHPVIFVQEGTSTFYYWV